MRIANDNGCQMSIIGLEPTMNDACHFMPFLYREDLSAMEAECS